VGGAGDVNGDGYDDLIVGAWRYDNGQADEGQAFVYLGSATGPSLAPDWVADPDQDSAFYGISVAGAGDVNGDGYDDVIVGAYAYDNGESAEGRAFVYHGSSTGPSLAPDWTAESNQGSSFFGYSVAGAGDVNGDGFDDVLVGASQYTNGQFEEGRAYVYHGSAAGLSLDPDWTAEPDHAFAAFGRSVAGAGDVNGDGFDDVIVGAYLLENGQSQEGRAYLYQGSATGPSLTPDWTAESDQSGAQFGSSVGGGGDVNADGFDDVIVGAPFSGEGGGAFVYHGSPAGPSLTADWTAESNTGGSQFGYSVAGAGDVNGDGFDDVLVGAYLATNDQSIEGRAFLFCGTDLGLKLSPCGKGESNQVAAYFGISVDGAGDVNGDGYDDRIVGSSRYDHGQMDEGVAVLKYGGPR
jgi:hypothetical protein